MLTKRNLYYAWTQIRWPLAIVLFVPALISGNVYLTGAALIAGGWVAWREEWRGKK